MMPPGAVVGVGEVHRLGPLLGDAVGGDDEVKPPLAELDEEAVKGLGDPLGLQAQLLGDGVAQVHLKAGELVLLVKVVEGGEGPFGADADLPALLDLVKGPHLGEGEAEGQDAEKHQDFTHGHLRKRHGGIIHEKPEGRARWPSGMGLLLA
jgi:hypothetical protein